MSVKHGKRAWQTKELAPLPLSLTWWCRQVKRPGLPFRSESKRKKGWELCECETRKEGMTDKRTVKEGAIR